MAVLHKKEEKIQAVLGRLPKKYTDEQFVAMFIKLYSKDWGKIKSTYIKQSQDKEPGTIINMPKPDLYLKQILTTYLQNTPPVVKEEEIIVQEVITPKAVVKKTTAKVAAVAKEPKAKAVTTKEKIVASPKVPVVKKEKVIKKSTTETTAIKIEKVKAAPKKKTTPKD